jgi:hypothetical protein
VLDGLLFCSSGSYHAFGEPVTEDNLEDEGYSMGFASGWGSCSRTPRRRCSLRPCVRRSRSALQMGLELDVVQSRIDDLLTMLDIKALEEPTAGRRTNPAA